MRCLVKMILKEPAENGKDYKWYEMTMLSHWDALAETHQILCIDTPEDFPKRLLKALLEHSSQMTQNYFRDPFSMHAHLLDQVVQLNDKSVWAIRHPIRDIEKVRSLVSLLSMSSCQTDLERIETTNSRSRLWVHARNLSTHDPHLGSVACYNPELWGSERATRVYAQRKSKA